MTTEISPIAIGRKFGWVPDLPDARDIYYAVPKDISIPDCVNMEIDCPPVYDQSTLGACTACSIGAVYQFEEMKQFGVENSITPSRLFIYYNERVIEGTVSVDRGAMLRTGMKCVSAQGVCPEPDWPYIIDRFAIRPTDKCYETALNYQVIQYQRLNQDLATLQACLAAGNQFVCGISIFDSFQSMHVSRTGIVPMPIFSQERMIGGHAIVGIGYNNETRRFRMKNSWGTQWGQNGYFEIPYEYLTNRNLSADFWTIQMVEK